jgi:anti-sigma B factor antagonist
VQTTREGDHTLVRVSGDVDIATRPELAAELDEARQGDGPILVDLTDVTFMDSTGLALMLALDRDARASGRPLAIACPEGPVRLLFAVSGVESELPLYPTRAAALAALDGSG